jgi:hypothetical protein
MDTLLGLFFLGVAVFVGTVLIRTFDFSRQWFGEGNAPEPTGIPGFLRDLIYGPLDDAGAEVTAAA